MQNKEKEPEITNAQEVEEEQNDAEIRNNGYSESEQAKDREMRSGDLQSLKKSTAFQQLHGSAKALFAYQVVSRQLSDLVTKYTHVMDADLHRAQKMLSEIARIRGMQKILLTKLFGKLPENISNQEILQELEQLGI